MLLHTVNWQLRRDDVLPRNLSDSEKWRFPRVALTPERQSLWQSGMRFVLPAFCLYLGTLVFLSRKLR